MNCTRCGTKMEPLRENSRSIVLGCKDCQDSVAVQHKSRRHCKALPDASAFPEAEQPVYRITIEGSGEVHATKSWMEALQKFNEFGSGKGLVRMYKGQMLIMTRR